MALNRRNFLQSVTGGIAAATLNCYHGDAFPTKRTIGLGVQLYSVRHELARDIPGTLAKLSSAGFEGVEFADYFDHGASDWRGMLDQAGLRACGTHIYLQDMLGDSFDATVEFNQTLGNPNLIVRWLPEELRRTAEDFQGTVALFNDVAERLKPHGMRVGYHNHDYIFEKFEEKSLWDILGDETSEDVILQLDTGNAARAGQDPVQLLRRHPGRTGSMHVKAFSKSKPAAYMGDDELDWPAILDLAETTAGVQWYIVEYEVEGVEPVPALEANLRQLKRLTGRT